jgi:hypothetical protein
MGALLGRCTNEMFCTLGASGHLIQVPEDGPFVCPLCGKMLSSPAAPRQHRLRDATLFSMGVSLAVLGAFVGGAFLGEIVGVTGLWPKAATTQVLASVALKPPAPVRHYASLLAPPSLAVKPPLRQTRRVRHL